MALKEWCVFNGYRQASSSKHRGALDTSENCFAQICKSRDVALFKTCFRGGTKGRCRRRMPCPSFRFHNAAEIKHRAVQTPGE